MFLNARKKNGEEYEPATGANIGSISGCTFQIFHGNVKIVQNERKRPIVIDSDEDD